MVAVAKRRHDGRVAVGLDQRDFIVALLQPQLARFVAGVVVGQAQSLVVAE